MTLTIYHTKDLLVKLNITTQRLIALPNFYPISVYLSSIVHFYFGYKGIKIFANISKFVIYYISLYPTCISVGVQIVPRLKFNSESRLSKLSSSLLPQKSNNKYLTFAVVIPLNLRTSLCTKVDQYPNREFCGIKITKGLAEFSFVEQREHLAL